MPLRGTMAWGVLVTDRCPRAVRLYEVLSLIWTDAHYSLSLLRTQVDLTWMIIDLGGGISAQLSLSRQRAGTGPITVFLSELTRLWPSETTPSLHIGKPIGRTCLAVQSALLCTGTA